MKRWFVGTGAALSLLAAVTGLQERAAATTILTIGDSITKGEGSFATGGYRMFLDQRLNETYQFIGKRRDENQPDLGDWQYHNGFGGYQAASNGDPGHSILKRFEDDDIIQKIGRPDVILLHVGTNTIGDDEPVTPDEDYTDGSDHADTQLYRLLTFLGEMCPTTKFILANITPDRTSRDTLADTYEYNFGGVSDGQGGIPGVLSKISSSIASRVTMANMFQIDLSSIGRQDLIGGAADPDNDGYIDWVLNFDEFDYDSAATAGQPNSALFVDDKHPTELGYQLMAGQWYQALRTAGVVTNPSPTAAAAGLAMLASRVRRSRRGA